MKRCDHLPLKDANPGKIRALHELLAAFRRAAPDVAADQWRRLFETGRFDKKVSAAEEARPRALPAAKAFSAPPDADAALQVVGQLESFLENRANEFREAVLLLVRRGGPAPTADHQPPPRLVPARPVKTKRPARRSRRDPSPRPADHARRAAPPPPAALPPPEPLDRPAPGGDRSHERPAMRRSGSRCAARCVKRPTRRQAQEGQATMQIPLAELRLVRGPRRRDREDRPADRARRRPERRAGDRGRLRHGSAVRRQPGGLPAAPRGAGARLRPLDDVRHT